MAPLGHGVTKTEEDTASDEAEPTELDSASEDPEEEAFGKEALERRLRAEAGLEPWQELRPAPQAFRRLAEAASARRGLVERGRYGSRQLGVFAEDVSSKGAKQWFLDTLPGFALAAVPDQRPRHLYEVILEDQPCWLYFDLEYSRRANPDVQPEDFYAAFIGTLSGFCEDVLGAALDLSSVFQLDSTTPEKFSQHVIVKRLRTRAGAAQNLAFKNNAQAGYLVGKFLEYARAQRQLAGRPGEMARLLFLRAGSSPPAAATAVAPPAVAPCGPAPPPLAGPPAWAGPALLGAAGQGAGELQETPVVDTGVYSRNRCFRVLFSSKLGKQRTLVPCWGVPGEPPARQLLRSLASFLPDGVELLEHELIPRDFAHSMLDIRRRSRQLDAVGAGGRQSVGSMGRTSTSSASNCPLSRPSPDAPLLAELANCWERVRRRQEPTAPASETGVQSTIEVDDRFLAVTLKRNRFCFCKGSSHKSNAVYLVVDRVRGVYYQKCHDVDCRHFRSMEFPLPLRPLPPGEPGWGVGPPQPCAQQPPSAGSAALAAPATPPLGRRRSSSGEDLPSPPRCFPLPRFPAQAPGEGTGAGAPPAKRLCCAAAAGLAERSRSSVLPAAAAA